MKPGIQGVISSVKCTYEINDEMKKSDERAFSFRFTGKVKLDYEDLLSLPPVVFSRLYRLDRIKKLKLRFPTGLLWEDNFWHWVYFSGNPIVYFDQTPAYCYRRRYGSIMSSVFKKQSEKLSEHFDIFAMIVEFYKKESLWNCASPCLVKLLNRFLLFCLEYCHSTEKINCCYKCRQLVDKYALNTSNSWVLNQLKSNTMLSQESGLIFSLKIFTLIQWLFPPNSFRRLALKALFIRMRKLHQCMK